jgi:DNA-binding CsgD family transcriptional regulator
MFPFIYWVLLPCIAGVLLFLGSFAPGSPLQVIWGLGGFFFFSLLTLFAVAFVLLTISQGEFSPLLSMGIIFILVSLAAQLGAMILNSNIEIEHRGTLLQSVSAAYYIYLLISPALQLWRFRRSSDDSALNETAEKNEGLPATCDALAAQHGLSGRETEILGYLARGYNSPYIANVLVISESTARTHIKRIYHKLGVNSRTQVIELVEQHTE